MRVKAKENDKSGSFLQGKEYHVITIEIYLSKQEIIYRLIPDDYIYSVIENADKFEIIDSRLASNWIFYQWNDHFYELTPEAWTKDDFWENFYSGEPVEREIYFNEILKMFPDDKILHKKIKKELKK